MNFYNNTHPYYCGIDLHIVTRSDLLVINKIDLAPYVGASLDVMNGYSLKMRGERPFVFSNLKTGEGLDKIVEFIISKGMLYHC